jgi:hypothetical protein
MEKMLSSQPVCLYIQLYEFYQKKVKEHIVLDLVMVNYQLVVK